MNNLLEYISNSPLVQSALTEAVHRYWHDRVLDDKKTRWSKEEKDAFELSGFLLSNRWRLTPNWRYILLNYPRRYQADDDTTSIPNDPPKVPLQLTISLSIK